MISSPLSCRSRFCLLPKKALLTHPLSGWIPLPFLLIRHRIIPSPFSPHKFNSCNHPKADKDCKLGVHTASNQTNEKKYQFYWGYKNHVLVDCISGLPIYELTTPAEAADSSVTLDILAKTHDFMPVTKCTFLADKGYDVENIYNRVNKLYSDECIIPSIYAMLKT